MATNQEIIHAYRHLYRTLLRAVQYTMPVRLTARDQLRAAFREPGATFDREGIRRTVWFLEGAAREKGMEHKILKNLLDVRRRRIKGDSFGNVLHRLKNSAQVDALRRGSEGDYLHYDMTVAMLNKTMGLCLR